MNIRTFFKKELGKFSFGVVGAKEFNKMVDDFQTLIDFLNDFYGIEVERLKRFLTDCVLTFVVSDILQGYLLQGKGTTERQSDLLLALTLFFDKIRHPALKARIVQFIFNRKIGVMHADLFLNNFETMAPVAEKYFVDGAPSLKHPMVAAQLIAVYEKHLTTKFDNISNVSFNDAARQAADSYSKGGPTPEKKFHGVYTQRTGMISHLPWQADLLPFALNDAVALIEAPDNHIENQIRILLLVQLSVA